jgi:hypothetical protein
MWQWILIVCLLSVTAVEAADGRKPVPVATRMRNLVFHVGHGVTLRVDDLVGRLVSTKAGPPVFDDVNAYRVELDYARVAMTPESLTNLLNNYVFAYPKAPLAKLKVGIEGNELTQSGVLKKGIDVPFTMRATIAATPDGRIRIHPTSMKAAGFVSKRVLDFFGLELEKLVKVKEGTGVTVEDDDLLLDAERLLPPPRIKGRLTKVWIENQTVVQQFGTPRKAPLTPPIDVTNYMYYRGGVLRFGKLTMQDTDLLLVDANQKDPFDFSPEQYNDQLVAGYSKNTPAHGLIVYMPDLRTLNAAGNQRAGHKPTERQHHE